MIVFPECNRRLTESFIHLSVTLYEKEAYCVFIHRTTYARILTVNNKDVNTLTNFCYMFILCSHHQELLLVNDVETDFFKYTRHKNK